MNPLLWTSLTALLLVWCLIRLAQLRKSLADTTLKSAVTCGLLVGGVWLVWLAGVAYVHTSVNRRAVDGLTHLAYFAAVLSLCPPMLVLGARRPTNRAWLSFVIVPMIVVLCWPVLTLALHGGGRRPLQLETPHLIAYLFVVVMSLGNYLGGALSFPTLLCGAGLATIGVVSADCYASPAEVHGGIVAAFVWLAVVALTVGVLGGLRRVQRANWPADRFDRVWQEFSTLYGLVWSRRLLDRINAIAVKQQWPGRLHADGFHWDHVPDDATQRQVEHALRWLLRRFVDPEWLDARLGPPAESAEPAKLSIDT